MRDPDKPQQIIDAAVRVFARYGFYNSRVSDIAREAGIASGTIYLYFKTKEEILVTLFREKMAGFVSALLKEGVEAGVFRADLPVKVATKMLFGAMDQVTTSWVLGKRGYRLADAAEPVANIFLKGVTRDGI